jgi:hypothetical protein
MVLSVDLTQQDKSDSQIKPKEIPHISFWERIKNKYRIWRVKQAEKPLSHKIILFILALSVTGLAAFALIYGFILYTTPAHEPLDTAYKLLDVQTVKAQTLSDMSIPAPPQIKDQTSPLNGVLFTKDEFTKLQERKPIMAMIENSVDARPQAGLSNADIVYETLAESGITRFMAVFWSQDAPKVGPIRSVRMYFLYWAAEYDDPPIANIGWAGYDPGEAVVDEEADARSYIRTYNVKSFSWYGRSVFWRDQEKFKAGKAWEHVAYTETETLWKDAKTLGWIGPADIESLVFKKDASLEERPLSQEITIKFLNISAESYKVKWVYDHDTNTYKRILAGQPHIDENTNQQLTTKNIIIQYCKYRPTGDKNGRIVFTVIGESKATIIRDGKATDGTWKKIDRTSRTKFYGSDGKEIELNRGQIWIEVVPTTNSNVTIQ